MVPDPWVVEATTVALNRMEQHAALVDLPNTDEATFRSFFMAALRQADPKAAMETEWCRFDLLARVAGRNVLVEFKYNVSRRMTHLDGKLGQWKGGAGALNEREFWECVGKLRACTLSPIHGRYLVLVYERQEAGGKKKRYHASYGSLCAGERIADVDCVECRRLFGKILTIAGAEQLG